jgi:hypothetical protein
MREAKLIGEHAVREAASYRWLATDIAIKHRLLECIYTLSAVQKKGVGDRNNRISLSMY